MDNNRKQEIQNQIAELQRELESLEHGVEVRFDMPNGDGMVLAVHVNAETSSDCDVMDSIRKWMNDNASAYPIPSSFDLPVSVNYGKFKKWNVTRIETYQVTPF